jgi:hypothetical protein
MNILTIGLAMAFVAVVVLIAFSMKKKEHFEFDSMYRRGLGKPVMSFDEANYIEGTKADIQNSYQPMYTKKIKIKDFLACPDGTYEMPNGKCLTSKYSPMFFDGTKWKCPANTVANNSLDWNMRCLTGFSDKKVIGGLRTCFNTQTETNDSMCMFNNDTVFTTRIYTGDGKWTCPPGSVDTGLNWGEGKIGGKQCLIKP